MKSKGFRLIILVLAIFLVSTTLKSTVGAKTTIGDLQKQININNQRKKELQKKIRQIKSEKASTQKEISLLDCKIENLKVEADGMQLSIDSLNEKINNNQLMIEKLKLDIDKNNEVLEKRIRKTYEKGGTGYLELIFKADNVVEALTRLDMVQLILKDDVDLLKNIKDKKRNITELKQSQETERENIENSKAELEKKKKEIELTQKEKEKYMASLEGNMKKAKESEALLVKENKKFERKIRELQTASQYVGGEMLWPVPNHYRITSPFGYRIHPIYGYRSFHRGIDIGCYYNTKIVAANDGVVIVAGWHYSYGNYVIIDHGGKKATVYGHNTKLLVKVGQRVKKGQTISLSGSTGESTGPHLHFEVRENGVVVNPLNYLKKK